MYVVEVRAWGERAILGAFQCAVGVVAPTARPAPIATQVPIAPAPTPTITRSDLNMGGVDRYNCDDFTTWQESNAAFQENQPGDPNQLDGNDDGIPCEYLPGSPVSR